MPSRGTGWLGILLGSRLYFAVVGDVLADEGKYEALIDDVVQEIRRLSPKVAPSTPLAQGGGKHNDLAPQTPQTPQPSRESASGAALSPLSDAHNARSDSRPSTEVANGAGASRSSSVVLNMSTRIANQHKVQNIHSGNTTIVLA